MGEANELKKTVLAQASEDAMVVDTMGGRVHVRWDETAQATPHGQIVFFAEFLATAGVFDRWVQDCPLHYSSPNASRPRDVLSTLMLGILAGSKRYAHIAGVRGGRRQLGWPTDKIVDAGQQHRPGRLVAAQTEHTLQSKRTDPKLLVGHVPGRRQPHPQWRTRLVEDSPSRHRPLVGAVAAHQAGSTRAVRFTSYPTGRTNETTRPAQLPQIGQTSLFAGEPVQKLVPVARIVFTRNGCCGMLDIHPVTLAQLELSGYPL